MKTRRVFRRTFRASPRNLAWRRFNGFMGLGTFGFATVQSFEVVNVLQYLNQSLAITEGREISIMRIKLNIMTSIAASVAPAVRNNALLWYGLVVDTGGVASTLSPSCGTPTDQRGDWLFRAVDGWTATNADGIVARASFRTDQGINTYDVKSRRRLTERQAVFLQVIAFNTSGGTDPVNPVVATDFDISVLFKHS